MTTRITPAHGCALVLLLGCLPAMPTLADDDGPSDWVVDQAMVELKVGADIEQLNAEHGTTVLASVPEHRLYLLSLPDGWTEDAFELAIEEDDRVEEAEVNHVTDAPEGQTQSFFVHVLESDYMGQYALPQIELAPALTLTTGGGVLVAVLDTGVDPSHPLLQGRLSSSGYDFVNDTPEVTDMGNGVDDDGDGQVDELVGHGTFLAGLIATVAPDAIVLPVKVLEGDGASNAFHVAQGIYYAVGHGADIINMSLGTPDDDEMIEIALEFAAANDVVVVAAAGNLDDSEAMYPADDPNTIAVAATDQNDVKADFSSFGEHVVICAPGVDVASTVPDGYAAWSGTSMATGLVSGAAALLRSLDPSATREQIESMLRDSADDITAMNPEHTEVLGTGRLNAAAAVGLVTPTPTTGDLDGDGTVDVEDLLIVILGWGDCPGDGVCVADADANGVVDVNDLMTVILNWG